MCDVLYCTYFIKVRAYQLFFNYVRGERHVECVTNYMTVVGVVVCAVAIKHKVEVCEGLWLCAVLILLVCEEEGETAKRFFEIEDWTSGKTINLVKCTIPDDG